MDIEELRKSSGYWIAKIQINLYGQLLDYMKKNNLNKIQLAKKLNISKKIIKNILNGNFNSSISKLVEISIAIGKIPKIEYENLEI